MSSDDRIFHMRLPRKVGIVITWATFMFVGILTNCLILALASVSLTTWEDVIHQNPHRNHHQTAEMYYQAPVFGIFSALLGTFTSVSVSAICAGFIFAKKGFISLRAVLVLTVPSALMFYLNAVFVVGMYWPNVSVWSLVVLPAVQLPGLLGPWVVLRRLNSSPARKIAQLSEQREA